jgi:tRNA (cmo5U34)-methyltransferase
MYLIFASFHQGKEKYTENSETYAAFALRPSCIRQPSPPFPSAFYPLHYYVMQDVFDPEKRFNERAGVYDEDILKIIPGYTALHETARYLLEASLPEDAFILVAGVGTGNETIACAQRNPEWRFTGFDIAANMIKTSTEKVKRHGLEERVELIHGTIEDVLQESFDAATALLVMHFIPYESKLEFLKGLNLRLNPGGVLVTADFTADRDSYEFESSVEAWEAYMLATQEKKDVDERLHHTRYDLDILSHEETLQHLKSAGFTNTRLFWKSLVFSAYISEKEDL